MGELAAGHLSLHPPFKEILKGNIAWNFLNTELSFKSTYIHSRNILSASFVPHSARFWGARVGEKQPP